VNRAEFLECFSSSETGSSPALVVGTAGRILRPIVEATARFLEIGGADFLQGGAVRTQPVRDDGPWPAVALHRFLMNFSAAALSRSFVTKDSSTSPS